MSSSDISERRLLGRRGSTTLEMALTASAFLAMLLGGLEIGHYYFMSESLKNLAGQLARSAVIDPDQDFSSQKVTLVSRTQILKLADFTTLDVAVARAAAPALTTVTVNAVYRYQFKTPVLSNLVNSISTNMRLSFVAP